MKLQDLYSLKGKVALVTGGGRGIGKFISTGLAEAGANLVIASRKMKNLEDTAKELEAQFGVNVLPVAANMEKPEEIDGVVKAAMDRFGRIDVLVNNAGYTWGAPTLSYPLERWDQVFNINVRGVWILTQKVANIMKNQGGGNIINVSSTMSFRGSLEVAHPAVAYNSSKAAINLLTMNLAVKLAPYKIRVNAIAPGYFKTDMMAHMEKPEMKDMLELSLNFIPLHRGGDMDDMKGVAVFLASEASAFITGAILLVDGGSLAQ